MKVWRNSLEARDERLQRHIAPPAPRVPGALADLKHCLAVIRSNGGKGFPTIPHHPARDREAGDRPRSAA